VRTAVVVVWVAAATLVMGLLAIALSLSAATASAVYRVARAWGRSILVVSGVQVFVREMEPLEPGRAFVFMSNHQSNFDIPVLLGHLPVPFRWLAKAELFKIPIFGRAMLGAGYIPIDRSDRPAAIASLRQAAEVVRGGVSVVIFPEGTRSPDGRLKPFKKGGFVMAIEAGVPIVPVVLKGTFDIMPKNQLLIRPRKVEVVIGEPIATADYSVDTKEALMDEVRNALLRPLKAA
jgi:1-acyl-sn-glycerol-3-phosphate acyltransferase